MSQPACKTYTLNQAGENEGVKSIKRLITGLLLLHASSVLAENGTIISDTALYQRPSIQSNVVQQLKAGTLVSINSRSGGWKKIAINKSHQGWVRSYRVRSGTLKISPQEQKSGGFFSGLASLSRKASGLFSSRKKDYSFQRTATIGVRGLSEEQIKNARPDLDELNKMETFRSNKSVAMKYARQGKLAAAKINHIPKSGAEQ